MNRAIYWFGVIFIGSFTGAVGFPPFVDDKFQWFNLCVLMGILTVWFALDSYLEYRRNK